MRRRGSKLIKVEDIPRCPECLRRKTVGRVQSVVEKRYKTSIAFNCCKAYYCNECLIEYREDGVILEPLLA